MSSISKAEKAYIQSSLLSDPPLRADGRGLTDFRTIALESGVAPLANGSARVSIGRNAYDGGGGTEVLAAAKLEVESVGDGEGVDGGRVVCSVSWYGLLLYRTASLYLIGMIAPQLHTLFFPQIPWMTYNTT
jgi:exosome complex component RRP42